MKNIIITGATGGIGREIVFLLAKQDYHIIMINRSKGKSQALIEKVNSNFPNIQIKDFICDLANPKEIEQVIASIKSEYTEIFALINNAGVLFDEEKLSSTGNDLHYQINVLAPYQLTLGLKELLKRGATDNRKAIIVNTSSNAIFMSKPLDVKLLKRPVKQGIFTSYANSKMAVTLLSQHLAKELAPLKIAIYPIDPGGNRTDMTSSKAAPFFVRWFRGLLPHPSKGAAYLLAPLLDASFKAKSGELVSSGKVKPIPKQSNTKETINALLKLIGEDF